MFMMGNFARIISLTRSRSTAGARCASRTASLWIPVLAGRDLGGIFVAERLADGRAVRVRRQPDVLPGRPRGLRLREGRWRASTRPPDWVDHVTVEVFGGDFGRTRAPTGAS